MEHQLGTLEKYVARKTLAPLLLFVLLSWLLVWVSQALRLGAHLSGALSTPRLVLAAAATSWPTIAGATLPYALVAALALCCTRLRTSGELEAMQAIGASPAGAFRGFTLLLVVAIGVGYGLLATTERPALRQLQATLTQLATRSLVSRLEARRFNRLGGGCTLYLTGRSHPRPDRYDLTGIVLIVERPLRVLTAQHASITTGQNTLDLELARGQGHVFGTATQPIHLRFDSLKVPLALGGTLRQHFGFISRIATPWHAAGLALTCLSFMAITLCSFLRLAFPSALALLAIGVAAHETVVWIVGQRLPAGQVRFFVALATTLVLLLSYTFSGRAKTRSKACRTAAVISR